MQPTEIDQPDTASTQGVPALAPPAPVEALRELAATPASVSIGFVSWMCFVTAVCTLLISFFGLKFMSNHSPGVLGLGGGASQQYVFVDEEKIYTLKLKEAMSRPGMSVEKAQEDAASFKNNVNKELSNIAQNGKIVLTKQAVLAGGESVDVTNQLAISLGFKP